MGGPRALRAARRVRPRLTRLGRKSLLVDREERALTVTPLDADAWLVRRRRPRHRMTVDQLDEGTWVLRRRRKGHGRRAVRHIGPRDMPVDLVLDERAVRRHMGTYQVKLLRHLGEGHVAWTLRRLRVNCVLDVGANRGEYAAALRREGYRGRIVSFEPLSEVAHDLEQAAADDPDWLVVRTALGDTDTSATMMVAGGAARMSSLREASEFGRSWSEKLTSEQHEKVSVRRLDGLFDEAVAGIDEPRVYLKLDAQGYDLQVFEGTGERIRDIVGMQSEVSAVPIYEGMPRMTEQLEAYQAAGFELNGIFPVILDGPTTRIIEFDAVLVRADVASRR